MRKPVLIFGCGPVGLAAAHAVALFGHEPVIYSRKRPSELFGAQYLHAPIPLVSMDPPSVVRYRLLGTPEGYRAKVYGPKAEVEVSPSILPANHPAWNIREAYQRLWALYSDAIVDTTISPSVVRGLLGRHDLAMAISSIPLPSLCAELKHEFEARRVWAYGDAPARGQYVDSWAHDVVDQTFEGYDFGDLVICSGLVSDEWYRISRIFSHYTVEWPHELAWKDGMIGGVKRSVVVKPLTTNCDCWPELHRIGRYGQWKKGVLVSDAYQDTEKLMRDLA